MNPYVERMAGLPCPGTWREDLHTDRTRPATKRQPVSQVELELLLV